MNERTTPAPALSHRVREARGRLSAERAAATLGLSSSALLEIEAGERDATVGQLLGAAGLYGVDLRRLLFGAPAVDPALAHLGAELAELLQEYLRERHGAERVEQLDDDQLADLNRVAGQVQRFGGLVEGLLRRGGGESRRTDELQALAEALRRLEHQVQRDPAVLSRRALPEAVPGFRFRSRPEEALRARHAMFRAGLDWYQRTDGRVVDDEIGFQRLLPWLQIVVPTDEGLPYLYCGECTPPAELWGETLARSMVGRFTLPDDALDRATARAFLEVQGRTRPLIQSACGPVVVAGRTLQDSWHRVVMPLQFQGLACVASLAVRDLPKPLD
ncbi:MAG: helix-turn-helix transcriptional regulator [Tistlia sp.]|uniref:helix-turn-helix domain-containing protein n=1 Tax=Tistlia sp. TaxID=3057121 RepID=UPI0034A47EB7